MAIIDEIWFPLLVTSIAGLSTVLGAFLVFFTDASDKNFLTVSLGFSAGVMIYVSFMEIVPEALAHIELDHDPDFANILMTLGFFAGILVILLIDKLVPDSTNPHNVRGEDEIESAREDDYQMSEFCRVNNLSIEECRNLERVGFMTALGIAIHNFPEGVATFMSAMISPELGISIALAIALHNIPEGIAVAIPTYQSTGSRAEAFKLTFLSGVAEPVGGLVGYFILRPFLNNTIFGFVLAMVAGIMVFISLDELIPASRAYGDDHLSIYGLIAGMAIMAISLIALG